MLTPPRIIRWPGLIEFFPLNEASGNRKGLYNEFTLTDINTVGSNTGLVYPLAASFDLANSEVLSIESRAELQVANESFWVFAWVNLTSSANEYRIIIAKGPDSAVEWRLYADNDSASYWFDINSRPGQTWETAVQSGSVGTRFGVPHLVIGWYDKDLGTINIRVDHGTVVSAAHTLGSHWGPSPLTIGNSSELTSAWHGSIGPCGYFRGVPTAEQMRELWNGGAGLKFTEMVSSVVVRDSFTDTAFNDLVTQHVGEVGAPWAETAGSGTNTWVFTDANRIRPGQSSSWCTVYPAGIPSSPDYDVVAVYHFKSAIVGQAVTIYGRSDLDNDSYWAWYDQTNLRWELGKTVGGSGTSLGTFSQSLTANTDYVVTLRMRGTSISLLIDGIERIAATDSAHTAVGRPMLDGYTTTSVTNTTGIHIGNFKVIDLASPITITPLEVVEDSFTDTAGDDLVTQHTGERGATWVYDSGPGDLSCVITNEGRVRNSAFVSGDPWVVAVASGVPSSPDYDVQATYYVKSLRANQGVNLRGRHLDNPNSYRASYNVGATRWELVKQVNDVQTTLGSFTQVLTVGAAYQVTLRMRGSTVQLLIDDVVRASATDSALTATGRAAIDIYDDAAGQSDSNGIHLDNFRVIDRSGYRRLPVSEDSFTDTAGTTLASHTGERAAAWTKFGGSASLVITDENRLRFAYAAGDTWAIYHTSAVPFGPDYDVRADFHVKSVRANQFVRLHGRKSTSSYQGYAISYVGTAWELTRLDGGPATVLGSYAQTLAAGVTYRVILRMTGSRISVLIDDVERIVATDSTYTAANRGGVEIFDGVSGSDNTNGIHLDNFAILMPSATPGTWNLAGLVEYWKLDEVSGNRAGARNGRTLTDNNTVGSAAGVAYPLAADFESSNSESLTRADEAALSVADEDFTIIAQVVAESKQSFGGIAAKGLGDPAWRLYFPTASDRFEFDVFSGTGEANRTIVQATALGSPALATPYFIAAWHLSVENTINIQGNGGLVNSAAYTHGSWNEGGAFGIGMVSNGGDYWDGLIGSVSYWKRYVLSVERAALFNDGAGLPFESMTLETLEVQVRELMRVVAEVTG